MADPYFDQPAPRQPATPTVAATSGPSPLLGLLMLAMAALLAIVIVGAPSPGPGPEPNPDVVVDDYAKAAEIAGKLEDRLYADIFDQLADETAAGKYKTVEAWHEASKQRLYDARLKAHEPVHTALNQIFPTGEIKDGEAAAKSLREIATGFRRSGR